jgi:hypothetical protein
MDEHEHKNRAKSFIGAIPPPRMEEEFDEYIARTAVDLGRAIPVEPIPGKSIAKFLHQLLSNNHIRWHQVGRDNCHDRPKAWQSRALMGKRTAL